MAAKKPAKKTAAKAVKPTAKVAKKAPAKKKPAAKAAKKSPATKAKASKSKATKYVYSWGAGKADGNGSMKPLLGGNRTHQPHHAR